MELARHRTASFALRVVLLSGFLLLAWLILAHPAFADDAPSASPTPSSSPTAGDPSPVATDTGTPASPAPTDPAGSDTPSTGAGTTTGPADGPTPTAAPSPDPAPSTESSSPSPTAAGSATPDPTASSPADSAPAPSPTTDGATPPPTDGATPPPATVAPAAPAPQAATTTAVINQAVSAFVASLVGSGAISANPVLGPSSLFDAATNPSFLATCNCSIAVSISINGDAYAIAIPGLSLLADGTVSTGNAGAISISGNGDASSSAISGSAGGSSGPISATSPAAGQILIDGLPVSMQELSDLIRKLIMQLLAAGGSSATGVSILPGGAPAGLAAGSTVSVQIAMSGGSTWSASAPAAGAASVGPAPALTAPPLTAPPLDGSSPVPGRTPLTVPGASVGCSWSAGGVSGGGAGGFGCAIAIAISINGAAHATVATAADNFGVGGDVLAAAPRGPPSPTSATTAFPYCTSNSAGSATAVSIAFYGVAYAFARTGNAGPLSCGPLATSAAPTTVDVRADSDPPVVESVSPVISSVSAAAGSTGNALAVALTVRGTATSNALSGDSGAVTVVFLGAGPSGTATSPAASGTTLATATADVLAQSGATGDAVSIAIARLGATSSARSGNSGTATATCTYCVAAGPLRAGEVALAVATSGRTGSIFALAVAGGAAAVDVRTGDSGSVTASFAGDPGPGGTPGDTPATRGISGGAVVRGNSGDTGDIATVVVALRSWIALDARTGDSGRVTSTALSGSVRAVAAAPASAQASASARASAPASRVAGSQPVSKAGWSSLSSWGTPIAPGRPPVTSLMLAPPGGRIVALRSDQSAPVGASHQQVPALRVPASKYVIRHTILEASWVIVPVSVLVGVFFLALASSTRRRRRTVNTS